jgi:threonine dehydratase
MFAELNFTDIIKAHERIKNHVIRTDLITNENLNKKLNAEVFLKMENHQHTSSFKARGVINTIIAYQEKFGHLPKKIVAQSSGNHAQAIAFMCRKLNIEALIYMANIVPRFKVEATRSLGAEVIICEKRSEANKLAEQKAKEGYLFIHPSDNDDVITGQGTATFEALQQIIEIDHQTNLNKLKLHQRDNFANIDAIFAPCGGGGLVIGCYLASLGLAPQAKIIGCEPLQANDAKISLKNNQIFKFIDSPKTIADGARTLAITERCFYHLKKISGICEISEEKIIEWQKYLSDILKTPIEPTSALSIAGVEQFIESESQKNNKRLRLLAIISGGNL